MKPEPTTKSTTAWRVPASSTWPGLLIVIGLLLAGFALRAVYAYGLPLNTDEEVHLQIARGFSVHPNTFNLPLGSRSTNHPVLSLYLTAAGWHLSGGSVFGTRVAFALFGCVGLLGVFLLARHLFGDLAAYLALALAAVDRHLITTQVLLLEPAYLAVVPWMLWSFLLCCERNRWLHWVLLACLMATGYWFSEVSLLVVAGMGLYVIASGQLKSVILNRKFQVAGLLFLLMIAPPLVWNHFNEAINFKRNAAKVGSFGFSPRILLLYVGDVLICFKKATWILLNYGSAMYMPIHIPCHAWAGAVYIAAVVVAVVRMWTKGHGLLFSVLLVVALFCTVVGAREPWNEFGWGSASLWAVLVVTAGVLARARFAQYVPLVLGICAIPTLLFLAGPKWTYTAPCPEVAYAGRMYWYLRDDKPRQDDILAAVRATDRLLERRPDSPVALHYRARGLTADPAEEIRARKRLAELAPRDPMIGRYQAEELIHQGRADAAHALLTSLVEKHPDCWQLHQELAEVKKAFGDHEGAAAHLRRALELKPEHVGLYVQLAGRLFAIGEQAEAMASLEAAAQLEERPHEAFLRWAEQMIDRGHHCQALPLIRRARELAPQAAGIPRLLREAREGCES